MLKLSALLPWILVVVGLYTGYCGLLFAFQRSLVFPGAGIRRPAALTQDDPQRQVVWLETSFGRVESWYFPVPGHHGPAPAVIIAHGNADCARPEFQQVDEVVIIATRLVAIDALAGDVEMLQMRRLLRQ